MREERTFMEHKAMASAACARIMGWGMPGTWTVPTDPKLSNTSSATAHQQHKKETTEP